MSTHAPDQVCQLLCADIRIIDTAHHGIFKADPAAGSLLIPAHGLDQLLHRVGIVDRHHTAADLVGGCVQRDGKGELQFFLRQLVDLGHKAAGGKADVAHADIDALGRGDILQKAHHFVKVVQRLADAHEHDMGDALADIFLGSVDLGADLACFKVAHTPRLCGGAEPAAHAAAHLRGHAHGIAVVVTHDNGLDAVAVRHAQQILHSTVFSLLTALDLRCSDIKGFFQLCQQGLGLVGHGRKLGDQLLVHPVEDLLCPETRLPQSFQFSSQFCQRQRRNTAFLFHSVLL